MMIMLPRETEGELLVSVRIFRKLFRRKKLKVNAKNRRVVVFKKDETLLDSDIYHTTVLDAYLYLHRSNRDPTALLLLWSVRLIGTTDCKPTQPLLAQLITYIL